MQKRVTLVGLLQAAGAVTVLFSVVTTLDSIHHGVELFVHFRGQYLVISVLLAIAFGLLRNPLYTGLMLLAAVVNAYHVVPWYIADAPQASGTPLKIVLANVRASSDAYERVLDFIDAESPDIVFLQEVTPAWMEAVNDLTRDFAFHYAEPRAGNFGIAMFSRVPLDWVAHVDGPPLGHPTIIATALVDERPLTLISTHPMIPLGRDRFAARNEQLRHVADLVAESEGPLVLIGDLNTTMWSHSYRTFVSRTGLLDARRGFGVLPTWPTFMPLAMIPIDHALVSSDVGVLDVRRGRRIDSDHLPLVVTVQL